MNNRRFSPQEETAILESYKIISSYKRVAKLFNCSASLVQRVVKDAGLTPHKTVRRYFFNESSFSPPLSPNAMYQAGWVATDGCISNSRDVTTYLKMILKEPAPISHLLEFLGHSGSPQPHVQKSSGRTYYQTQVCSQQLVSDLVALGITQRKTHTLHVHEGLASNPDFWAGAIGGDGCFSIQTAKKKYKYLYCILTTGSKEFCDQYVAFLTSLGLPPSVSVYKDLPNRRQTKYYITIGAGKAEKFVRYMLANCKNDYWLKYRKWQKAVEFIHTKDSSLLLQTARVDQTT